MARVSLDKNDLTVAISLLGWLHDVATHVDGLESIQFTANLATGCRLTIGYGESGDPEITDVWMPQG